MRFPRRTVATSVALVVTTVLVTVSYRLRHPPMRVHAQAAVPFPGEAGEYRFVTFTRGRTQWTASVAHLRAGQYRLGLLAAPGEAGGGGPGTWIQAAATDAGALVAVNGGYFDERRRPVGLRVVDGRETSPVVRDRPPLSGVLHALPDGNAEITPVAAPLPGGTRTAVQAGPLLVEPGGRRGVRADDGGPAARRTAVATTAGGDLLVIATSPVTLGELAEALVNSPASFGVGRVDCALNLDGGPSTAFLVRTPTAHVWTPPAGAVPDAVVVLPGTR